MQVVSSRTMQTRRGPQEWFTGDVWLESASVPSPGAGLFRVLFEPGARTNWHTHPEGQFLYVVTGGGRVGKEGGSVVEITAGDLVYFARARSTGTARDRTPTWSTWPSLRP